MKTEVIGVSGYDIEGIVAELNSKIKEKESDGFEVASVNHIISMPSMCEPKISMYAVLQKGF